MNEITEMIMNAINPEEEWNMDAFEDDEEEYEAEPNLLINAIDMQKYINSGTAWMLEGSFGRAAMDMIEAGQCMVGIEAQKDYWGNTVPARKWLEPGTKGTPGFVEERMGNDWLEALLETEGTTE